MTSELGAAELPMDNFDTHSFLLGVMAALTPSMLAMLWLVFTAPTDH